MKILWLINIMLPEVALHLEEKVNNTGGWLVTLSKELSQSNELIICYPDNQNRIIKIDKKVYYGCETSDRAQDIPIMVENFREILLKENPDIIHIWGTEHLQTFAMTAAAKLQQQDKVIISIQGMVSVYARHFMAALSPAIQYSFTFRDIIRNDRLLNQRKNMEQRGKYEIQAINNVSHIIGRTTWDRICVNQINPNVQYHFNNEILRDSFYIEKWDLKNCQRYSIFISQAQTPIKGFHFVIEAIALLHEKYPHLHVYVAGGRAPMSNSIKSMAYSKYLEKLAKEKNVFDKITYVGNLNEQEMCSQYLKSHVFISAASIENSPNSVGEAMLLGMPIVASYVGGTNDLLKDKVEGFLYPYDAPYMLAGYIDTIFNDDKLAVQMGQQARIKAKQTHDKNKNFEDLLSIYKKIDVL